MDPKLKWALVIAGVFALASTEGPLLGGEVIFEAQTTLNGDRTFMLPLEAGSTRHRVEIWTDTALMVDWSLTGPEGFVMASKELAPNAGTRSFTFVPTAGGSYSLSTKGTLRQYDRLREEPVDGTVKLRKGDHRIIAPLLHGILL